MSREREIAAFVAAHGFGGASLAPLAQDASFRRYWRLRGGPLPAVLMDAPPGREDVRPFLAVQEKLAGAGLAVPAVLAADAAAGLVLMQDFGDGLFAAVLTLDNQQALYDAATDALVVLHRVAPPDAGPRWGAAEMAAATSATFLDWWWPAAFGEPAATAVRQAFDAAMGKMLGGLETGALVHRDYFAENLFWLGDRVGIIDFQDAAAGPAAYDLVSLVQDARRDLPEALGERQIGRYMAARPELDRKAYRAAFAVCAAQRHLRVASLWVRLDRRDGKPAYLAHGQRCWALLGRALNHPATAPLAAFLDAHVPVARRCNP